MCRGIKYSPFSMFNFNQILSLVQSQIFRNCKSFPYPIHTDRIFTRTSYPRLQKVFVMDLLCTICQCVEPLRLNHVLVAQVVVDRLLHKRSSISGRLVWLGARIIICCELIWQDNPGGGGREVLFFVKTIPNKEMKWLIQFDKQK